MKFVLDRKHASRLIHLCFLMYSAAYVGRYSYAAGLLNISGALGIDKDMAGMVSSFFFFSYAAGQLLNAWLARYYEPRRVVTLSLTVSALCNLGIGLCSGVTLMCPIWLINGIFQSTLWCSLLNIQSKYLAKHDIPRAILWNSVTLALGTFLSYGMSSLFTRLSFSWRIAFYVSAATVALTALVWWLGVGSIERCVRDGSGVLENPEQIELPAPDTAAAAQKPRLFTPHFTVVFVFACIVAASSSFIRDGVVTWMPTILFEEFAVDKSLSIALTMVLPIISFFAAFLVRVAQTKLRGNMLMETLFFGGITLCLGTIILLYPLRLALITLVLFALSYLFLASITNVTTSVIPFACRRFGNVGSTSALLDACCYAGSVVSTYGLGAVAKSFGWMSAVQLITVIAAVSIVITLTGTLLARRDAHTKEIL
ncbi:MAG: MFS transporter [Clostridia bacterium]|nr:MFS transporter [Clostridia bacterium]